jgi:hypothetical protein
MNRIVYIACKIELFSTNFICAHQEECKEIVCYIKNKIIRTLIRFNLTMS